MENTYNKVQYSEFTDNGKLNGNGQWVIRTETYTEAMAILEQIRKGTPGSTLAPIAVTPATPQTATQAQGDSAGLTSECKECGAPAKWREGVAKSTGKPWKGWFCTASREHKPFFIK